MLLILESILSTMKVQNKVIVVTGGGDGMGREIVLLLLKKGAKVAAVDLRQEALDETHAMAEKIGLAEHLSLHLANIANHQRVQELPTEILNIHGSIDGLFNNAGIIQPFVKINDLDFPTIDRVMQVNFYGLVFMTKSFLPLLLTRPEAHIVNTSSMGGFLPVPGQSIYGASKAAVKLFTEGLHSEMRNTKVGVTVVFPGAIQTHITENSGVKMNMPSDSAAKSDFKMLSATKAAEMIVGAMENNKYRVCVGSDSKFLDLLYRVNPKFAAGFIAKQMGSLLK